MNIHELLIGMESIQNWLKSWITCETALLCWNRASSWGSMYPEASRRFFSRRTQVMKRHKTNSSLEDKWGTSAWFFLMRSCRANSKKTLFNSHISLMNSKMCLWKGIAELGNRQFHLWHRLLLYLEYSTFSDKSKGKKSSCSKLVAFILLSRKERLQIL